MNKIMPNLTTLNNVLEILVRERRLKNRFEIVMKVISEFEKLGVTPSLGTYYYLIHSKCYNHNRKSTETRTFIKNILQNLIRKKLSLNHSSDFYFFPKTMNILSTVVNDSHLAHMLHGLLLNHDNVKFISNNLDELRY